VTWKNKMQMFSEVNERSSYILAYPEICSQRVVRYDDNDALSGDLFSSRDS